MLAWLAASVGSRLMRLVAIASAVGAMILGVFFAGKRDAKKDQEIKDLKDYKDTKERIDEAKPSDNRDDALKRLSRNNQLR